MNMVKTTLLLGILTGIFLAIGYSLGGERGMLAALAMAGLMNFVSFFWSDKIVLKAYRAQPVTQAQAPQLYAIVERLARKAEIPMPALYVLPDPALNAFATGRSPKHAAVAATEGILRALTPEELEGVLAHELSHVLNRDTLISTVAATIAGAISYIAHFGLYFGGGGRDDNRGANPLVAIATMILAPIAALMVQMAVSRSREYSADQSGARLVGYPQGLMGALRKLQAAATQRPLQGATQATAHLFIVNPLRGRSLMGLFSTHPPLEERIERLSKLA
jgi:heat shock protein HtpX